MSPLFSQQEWLRYTRHVQLSDFGAAGQMKLKRSHVLIVGLGGLGAPVSMYLAAAGVGNLTLMDGDSVDLTNLQRQVIYSMDDIGKPKAQASAQRLASLNPDIHITNIDQHFSKDVTFDHRFDLIIDCTDNFQARYAINDFCLQNNTPWIYASVHKHAGQCAVFTPGNACFRCLFSQAPENIEDCNSAGVMGVLPGMLGLFQANEAIQLLANGKTSLCNTLMLFDAKSLSLQKITLARDPECFCSNTSDKPTQLTVKSCEQKTSGFEISYSDFNYFSEDENTLIVDVRSSEERNAFHLGGLHIELETIIKTSNALDKSKRIVCYCQSGARSLKAAQRLSDLGYDCLSLRGGIVAWLRESQL